MYISNRSPEPSGILELPTIDQIQTIIRPEVKAFMGSTGEYQPLFRQAVAVTLNGDRRAIKVPAAQFMAQASFRILADPSIRAQLPSEVNERGAAAAEVVDEIVDIALGDGIFATAYGCDKTTDYYWQHDKSFSNEERLKGLGQAPFVDTSWVTGGALKMLLEKDPDQGEHAPAIRASLGLLVVAKVEEDERQALHDLKGQPYIDRAHLDYIDDKKGVRVRPNQAFVNYLETFKKFGRGCPAGKMTADIGFSLLRRSWYDYVDFLVPPFATADQ